MPTRPKDTAISRETAKHLGEALRSRRFDQQLTQAQLADRLDISIEAYSRLERGQALPSFPTLLKICETLETTPDALLLATGTAAATSGRRSGPRIRSGEPPDPARAAESRQGEGDGQQLEMTMGLLRLLDQADRAIVHELLLHLARRAGSHTSVPLKS